MSAEWTTETPTNPGWYVRRDGYGNEIVKLFKIAGTMCYNAIGDDDECSVVASCQNAQWLGPFSAEDVLAGMLVRDDDYHTCFEREEIGGNASTWEGMAAIDTLAAYRDAIIRAAAQDTADDGGDA